MSEMRLQRALARAGVASRRAAETLIREGKVRVDGKVAELGSKVEQVMGHLNTLLLCLAVALISNVSQFQFSEGLFGGMSGVVYGLLGFCWAAPLMQPRWPIQPRPAIMVFMVGWLVVCMLGLTEALGFGAVANAAHLGGLLSGLVLGLAFGLLSRSSG